MSKTFEVVPFHDHEILTVREGEDIIVPLKPVVDAIGLAWNAQFERVKRHPVLSKGIRVTRIPSQGGMQEMTGLTLDMVPGFLTTIQSERIKDAVVRERVILFQAEAFQALFAYFFGGRRSPAGRGAAAAPPTTGELLKLVERMKEEGQPEIRAMLYALLEQMCGRMNLPLPAIEAFGQPNARNMEIARNFFEGIGQLVAAGVEVNRHRRTGLFAVALPEVARLFEERAMGWVGGTDLHKALRNHPAFVSRAKVNCRDGVFRACWVFDVAKLPWQLPVATA